MDLASQGCDVETTYGLDVAVSAECHAHLENTYRDLGMGTVADQWVEFHIPQNPGVATQRQGMVVG